MPKAAGYSLTRQDQVDKTGKSMQQLGAAASTRCWAGSAKQWSFVRTSWRRLTAAGPAGGGLLGGHTNLQRSCSGQAAGVRTAALHVATALRRLLKVCASVRRGNGCDEEASAVCPWTAVSVCMPVAVLTTFHNATCMRAGACLVFRGFRGLCDLPLPSCWQPFCCFALVYQCWLLQRSGCAMYCCRFLSLTSL